MRFRTLFRSFRFGPSAPFVWFPGVGTGRFATETVGGSGTVTGHLATETSVGGSEADFANARSHSRVAAAASDHNLAAKGRPEARIRMRTTVERSEESRGGMVGHGHLWLHRTLNTRAAERGAEPHCAAGVCTVVLQLDGDP